MANRELAHPHNAFADRYRPRRFVNRRPMLLLFAMTSMCAVLLHGCGDPVLVLNLSAPASVVAGSPFAVTVTVTANGSRDTIFNSPVRFTSSDPAATLPIDYAFIAADAGSHTFTGVVLTTAGTQTIKVTDLIAPSINGTATIAVTAADNASAK